MAHSYFSPPPARRHSSSEMQEELSGDLEQSIFIFPNPRTERDPPSPLSIPTDVSFPSTTTTTERRGRRTSSVSGVSEWATISGRSVSADTSMRSPLVEVWEMSDDAEGEELTGDETPGPAVPPHALSRQQLQWLHQERYALGRCPYPNTFVYFDGRFQLRSRKQSDVSASPFDESKNTGSASLSDPELPTFHRAPPRRLPLLAFFSSLFSIENTTIHLLNRPSHPHASPLFPGARLYAIDDNDITLDEKRALFYSSPSGSLKAGVEVAADSFVTLDNVFALPLPPLPFTYIWDLVAGVYSKTVPKRVRLRARTSA